MARGKALEGERVASVPWWVEGLVFDTNKSISIASRGNARVCVQR